MLLLKTLLVVSLLSISFGLKEPSFKLSVEYFKLKDLKYVVLLECEDIRSSLKFTKIMGQEHISVSTVLIDESFTSDKLKKSLDTHFRSSGVVMNAKCHKSEDVLYFASENAWLDSTHSWLLIEESNNTDNGNETEGNLDLIMNDRRAITDVLENLNISIDADIILAFGDDNMGHDLYDVYNYGKVQGGNLTVNKAGTWSLEDGLRFIDIGYKYYRRWDFNELPLRMISVAFLPVNQLDLSTLFDARPTPGFNKITKTSAIMLNVIAELHNFTFVHTFTDRWIGSIGENGSKAVSIAMFRKEQDVSPVLRYLSTVSEQVDFIHPPVNSIETRYYYRIPNQGAGKFENQFLRPLSTGAWICVIAVSTLCAVSLLVSAKFERRPTSVQYAVFSVFASICQQFFQDTNDTETRRTSAARKLTILVTGVSCVLIYNYYTSSVVSWLLNGPPPSINSLKELLESPLELIYEDIGYTKSWLQSPNYYYNRRNMKIEDEIRRKKVFNKKKGTPLLVPVEEGIAMVKAGGYAYHTEVDSANTLISRTFTQSELCELGSLLSMEKTVLYVCVQKHSPYKEFLIWNLMRLSESGIVSCIQRRTSSQSVACEGSSPRALALGGASPAFILLAAGYFLATAIMLAERFHKKLQTRALQMVID